MDLKVYADTQLFIQQVITLTWKQIKDSFAKDFKEDLEDRHVYLSIQWSGLYQCACR